MSQVILCASSLTDRSDVFLVCPRRCWALEGGLSCLLGQTAMLLFSWGQPALTTLHEMWTKWKAILLSKDCWWPLNYSWESHHTLPGQKTWLTPLSLGTERLFSLKLPLYTQRSNPYSCISRRCSVTLFISSVSNFIILGGFLHILLVSVFYKACWARFWNAANCFCSLGGNNGKWPWCWAWCSVGAV